MGVKVKFLLKGACIGVMHNLRDAEDYHRRLVEKGYPIQMVAMRSDIPDIDIDGKKYRYVISSELRVYCTDNIAQYFDYLLATA